MTRFPLAPLVEEQEKKIKILKEALELCVFTLESGNTAKETAKIILKEYFGEEE